jgi:DNA transformation protein and related proteins
MTRIRDLPCLGNVTERQFAELGIHTAEALLAMTPLSAFAALKHRFGRQITLNALYALDCAFSDTHWRDQTEARRAQLKELARQLTQKPG